MKYLHNIYLSKSGASQIQSRLLNILNSLKTIFNILNVIVTLIKDIILDVDSETCS
jgi:hypothetical protein